MAQAERPPGIISMSSSSNLVRDLLERFLSGEYSDQNIINGEEAGGGGGEVELSLGLSLNGRFGVDPRDNEKLTRSSSIPDFVHQTGENGSSSSSLLVSMVSSSNLVRTCSSPAETEEAWRKRKEMQTLRRLEAKRKRSEKLRNSKAFFVRRKRENGATISSQHHNHHEEQILDNASSSFGVVTEGLLPRALVPEAAPALSSQGSVGSQGSVSSGISESSPAQGTNKCNEAKSPASVQSLSASEQKLTLTPGSTITEKPESPSEVAMESSRPAKMIAQTGSKEMVRYLLEDMPCVSTKADGPDGKRIEGFLYKYGKGDEVSIICICHGSFLSPAEFVKHAGGNDIEDPHKHIVVNPPPLC